MQPTKNTLCLEERLVNLRSVFCGNLLNTVYQGNQKKIIQQWGCKNIWSLWNSTWKLWEDDSAVNRYPDEIRRIEKKVNTEQGQNFITPCSRQNWHCGKEHLQFPRTQKFKTQGWEEWKRKWKAKGQKTENSYVITGFYGKRPGQLEEKIV